MKLIGMLDSPYVRRTAIALTHLEIAFDHLALSVFNDFANFQQINPVVKAPTLVFNDGETLMDSNLILNFAQSVTACKHRLIPLTPEAYSKDLRLTGLALAACEKMVQIIYENNLRPNEKHYEPWLARITQQLLAACRGLEGTVTTDTFQFTRDTATLGGITTAVTWQFVHSMRPDLVPATEFPALVALGEKAEQTPEFMAFPPIGPGVVRND